MTATELLEQDQCVARLAAITGGPFPSGGGLVGVGHQTKRRGFRPAFCSS